MKILIERKRPMVKKFFGGTKEADYESAMVTINFSDEERQILVQNRLHDHIVYEHPNDERDYEKGQQDARDYPNSYAGQHPAPRYRQSKFVRHFLETPTQEVYDHLDTPMRFAEIQTTVENNLKALKNLMAGIQSFPTDSRTIEL